MEKGIELNYNQASALQQLLSDYDLDVEVAVYDSPLDEDETSKELKARAATLTPEELEKLRYGKHKLVVKIDKMVLSNLPDIIEEFKEARYWYKEFNESVISMLGDGDGALFLALIAFFSARNALQPNIKEAVRMYTYFKDDYAKDPESILGFIDVINRYDDKLTGIKNRSKKSKGFGLKYKVNQVNKRFKDKERGVGSTITKYNHLKMYDFLINDLTLPNHWYMVSKLFKYYIKRGGRVNVKILVDLLLKSVDEGGDIVKGEDTLTSGYKIFNFALNLLDPKMEINKFKHSWFPVTIDSWMIYFFYPQWRVMEEGKRATKIGGVFKSKYKYAYLASIINKKAKEVGMTPNELQAVIWVSMLKKHKPNSAKDLSGSLDRIIEDFESKNDTSESMVQLVKQWKSKINQLNIYYDNRNW